MFYGVLGNTAKTFLCKFFSTEFSEFGEAFLRELDKKISRSQNIRDKALREQGDLKAQQEKLENELRAVLDEQELKYKEHFKPEPETDIALPPQDDVVIFIKPTDISVIDNENNVVVVESAMADLNLDSDRKSNLESDRKLKSRKNYLKLNKEAISDSHLDSNYESGMTSESSGVDSTLPPHGKAPKRTKKLVPSTFVPNRTLQLRRSGSLSNIDKSVQPNGKLKPLDTESEKSDESSNESRKAHGSDKGPSKRTRSTSSKRTPFY